MPRQEEKTPPPRSPSPQHDPVFIWPTPNHEDYLFWVEKNGDLPKNRAFEYGDAYPDANKYPHHKLVHVSEQTTDKWSRWYYASDRIDEDEYNWEFADADIGGVKFNAVKRTYLVLRSAFDPDAPTMGTAMVNVPEDRFTGTYVLAERQQVEHPDKVLNGLYVIEQRTYVQKVTMTDVVTDEQSGGGNPVETTLYYRGETITFGNTTQAVEAWFADPVDDFWATDDSGFANEGRQLSDNWFSISYRKVITLDALYESSMSRLRPSRFFCPQGTSTVRTVTADNTPGPPTTAVASEGQEVKIGKRGRIMSVETTTQSGTAKTLKGTTVDDRTGRTYLETQELVAQSDVTAGTGVDASGKVITYEPIDACWAAKVERTVVSPEVRSWVDIINYEWPPVLKSIVFDTYDSKSGGSAIYPIVDFKEGFTGPQKVEVSQYWQLTPPVVIPQISMIPEGFQFRCPLYSLGVPPCLHNIVTLFCNIGTTDPEWEQASYSRTFAATNYTDWPDTIFWRESKPYRGGYIVTEYTLNKPE